jgi:hypothetical protein
MQSQIEYATLADGTRLRYLKDGSGPALILLHTAGMAAQHGSRRLPPGC